jgi:ABC-type uncharacterized transport system substrate-binding protein
LRSARLSELLAADLVRLRVDVIVTRGSTFVQGAKRATSSIPIVFTIHADPVGRGKSPHWSGPPSVWKVIWRMPSRRSLRMVWYFVA